jgi:RND family efflux transporter MFP subunit
MAHQARPTATAAARARAAVLTLAIITIGSVLTVAGCGKETATVRTAGKEVRATVAQAHLAPVEDVISVTGDLAADKSINIATRMMGWIVEISVDAGQYVRAGAPLIKIDDTDLRAKRNQARAAIAEAEAVLANAEKMVERFEKLYAEKSATRSQLDDVLTGRDRAAAGLRRAEESLREVEVHMSYLDIVAPVSGVIARKLVEEGDMANPGMPLLVLEQTEQMKVIAHVGEKDISAVRAGTPITVAVTSLPNAHYTAPIDRIVPAANPGSRTYDIEATIANPDGSLRSGMFARIDIPTGTREVVLAPTAAVVRRGQLTGFWVVDEEQRAHLRWVRLGGHHGEEIAVLSGLHSGETVVLQAEQPLAEGDKVVK